MNIFNVGVGVNMSVGMWAFVTTVNGKTMERRWRVVIRVMTVHLIDLISDILRCFTTFYSFLFYLYRLLHLLCVKFEWPKRKFFILGIYVEYIKQKIVFL